MITIRLQIHSSKCLHLQTMKEIMPSVYTKQVLDMGGYKKCFWKTNASMLHGQLYGGYATNMNGFATERDDQ